MIDMDTRGDDQRAEAQEQEVLAVMSHWHWRNCRDIGFGISIWPLTWGFGVERSGDLYGVRYILSVGPLCVTLEANIGNVSSENRFEAWRGLSEGEAYERALRYEGKS